jgi:hypothetical protein
MPIADRVLGELIQRSKRRQKKAGRAAEGKRVGGMERKKLDNSP